MPTSKAYLQPGQNISNLLEFAYSRNLIRYLVALHLLTEEEACHIETICEEYYKVELFGV